MQYWEDMQSVRRFCYSDNIAPIAKCQQVLLLALCLVVVVVAADNGTAVLVFMAALCNRGPLYFCPVVSFFFLSSFFSSPNLSGRRLDVCHTSTHGVALV